MHNSMLFTRAFISKQLSASVLPTRGTESPHSAEVRCGRLTASSAWKHMVTQERAAGEGILVPSTKYRLERYIEKEPAIDWQQSLRQITSNPSQVLHHGIATC